MSFPATTFTSEAFPIAGLDLPLYGREAVDHLAGEGLAVLAGANALHAAGISSIAFEPGVRANCHNDSDNRVATPAMLEEWEDGGYGTQMYTFVETDIGLTVAESVVGYGWLRPEENEHVPGGLTAFAIRLSRRVAGRKLAAPATEAMVASGVALGATNIHLSTFLGNPAAWKSYIKAGAVEVARHDDTRLAVEEVDGVPDGTVIDETRLYQIFPHTFTDVFKPKE